MKHLLSLSIFALHSTHTLAFPAHMLSTQMNAQEQRDLATLAARIESEAEHQLAGLQARSTPSFSATQQYVSNQGKHAFVPPNFAKGDQRGPCPGLNAMANHGYIPHNGVATVSQFVKGTYDVFGMGADLATLLSVYGAVIDGDLTSWSIGGPPPAGLLGSIGLVGAPQGISNSHNKYETDGSPTRPDLYTAGNDYKLVMSQFEDLYSQPLGPSGYDLTTLTPFRAKRSQQSISTNPHFFNGPFTGVGVQPAAYTFIYRFMGNKSAEYPSGYLSGDVMKSFFGITGSPGSFQWNEGCEKIPDNWYKRAIGDDYGILAYGGDLLDAAKQYPQFLDVGGNLETVDSFAGLDVGDLTGGVYNLEGLLEGNNALCFAYQFAQQATPDLVKGLFVGVANPLAKLNDALGKVFTTLGCPQLGEVDTSLFDKYPGATGSF